MPPQKHSGDSNMRKIPLALTLLGLVYVAGSFSHCLAEDKKDITMTGTFVWDKKKGQNHDIKAVFTPNGDKKWNVVFTFQWAMGKNKHKDGGEQSWKGTAEGDLVNGDIKGEGLHPNGVRKFTFTGTSKDGKIDATHTEVS